MSTIRKLDNINSNIPVRENLLELLLADKRSAQTRRVYRSDIAMFFKEMYPQVEEALAMEQFLALTQFNATAVGIQYKAQMLDRGLKEATVNRRLAALRSLVELARKLGKCTFHLIDAKGLKVTAYRDTSGLTKDEFKLVLKQVDKNTRIGVRDFAILLLLWTNALRRSEVSKLKVSDFNYDNRTLRVLGKGKGTNYEVIELPKVTADSIWEWLASGKITSTDNSLFTACDFYNAGHGLTGDMISRIVKKYCSKAGITKRVSAHTMRHSSITAALDASDGNVRKVQKLSRHADIRTLTIYDDNRNRHQGEMSDVLADLL